MAQYYVAERARKRWLTEWFGLAQRFEACDHRHVTVSGAKKCAAHHNAVARSEGTVPRLWSVGARVSRGGNAPQRILPLDGSPVSIDA